ncbi:MAG: histidine kinase [Desertifilum sp. SIO1I2]|nr:histidine kinase [Desertifilum sp. SIO1I2]
MQATSEKLTHNDLPLQLLLFVDKRPHSAEQIRQIRHYLKQLSTEYPFELTVVDVGEQPHLAEHFRLVATPTLLKIHPEPRQSLAGTNLTEQLEKCWPRWQRSAETFLAQQNLADASAADDRSPKSEKSSLAHSAELIQLSDEVFRLKQEKEHLQEQLQFKDRIIAMLAHDLRNPLTAASLAIETLELSQKNIDRGNSPRLNPTWMNQLLKHARLQIKAMDRMITDILQVAKGTNARFNVVPQKMDLGALCQEALDRLDEQFQLKTLTTETDIPQDLPYVYADPERVRQVIINLLDNAIKYTPTGGKIHLSILHRTTQKVQVSICDTGPGIPEDNQEKIFEDRFRLKRDEEQEGYGIGLSLCQRIVRAHYGQIWVDSGSLQGSCFHFTLPVYRS